MQRKKTIVLFKSHLKEDDPDYTQLLQSRESTEKRHSETAKLISLSDKIILDIGCGTGLFIERLKDQNVRHYYGIDIIEEREQHVLKRLNNTNIPGNFICLPETMDLLDFLNVFRLVVQDNLAALCIGMLGTGEYNKEKSIYLLLKKLREITGSALITIPRQFKGAVNIPYIKRFDDKTVNKWVQMLDINYVQIQYWEHTLYWNN